MEDWSVDSVASWVGIGLSVFAMVIAAWVRHQTNSSSQIKRLQEEVDDLRSYRDKLDGARLPRRMASLEERQNKTDTALARLEQRLTSIDTVLSQIAGNVQAILHRGGTHEP